MYSVTNIITGTSLGRFQSYDSADNFRMMFDDFYVWLIEKNDYVQD